MGGGCYVVNAETQLYLNYVRVSVKLFSPFFFLLSFTRKPKPHVDNDVTMSGFFFLITGFVILLLTGQIHSSS